MMVPFSSPDFGNPGELRIGYLPLLDAAPLLLAEELGLFADRGLSVRLQLQLGWGSIRANLLQGHLDAAQAPLGLIFSLPRLRCDDPEFVVSLVLTAQGNAITLSSRLWDQGVGRGQSLRRAVDSVRPSKLTFAVVAPYSNHFQMLQTWLRRQDIDPEREVHITILPPPLVGEHLTAGLVDGFCVGEPWNSELVFSGQGWIVCTSAELAPDHPEKVLLSRRDWTEADPERAEALCDALREACAFAEAQENREQLVELVHRRLFDHMPREVVANSLVSPCELGADRHCASNRFCRFSLPESNRPTEAHGRWLLELQGHEPAEFERRLSLWRAALPPSLV